MTAFDRGSVVLIPVPFSDQSSAKLRPAIIAHPAYPSEDLLVVGVSSASGALRPGEVALRYWREAGLIHPSFLKRAIATVSQSLIRRHLGKLQAADIKLMDEALSLWFQI